MNAPTRDIYYCYFLESHLKSINNVEIQKDDNKCLKSLKKLLEKEFQDKENQEFIISVYVLEYNLNEVKKKDKRELSEGEEFFSPKLELKVGKNKFEGSINVRLKNDTFLPSVKFEFKQKLSEKLLQKKSTPPIQYQQLSLIEIMQLFTEALVNIEKRNINDPTYKELTAYGYYSLIRKTPKVDLVLFLMIYIDAINERYTKVIRSIFDVFDINNLVKPSDQTLLSKYHEKLHLLYNDQVQIFEYIKKYASSRFDAYLIRFYTLYINAFYMVEDYDACEKILIELRDNNPFDKSILPKLFLSEYSYIYRNIPISNELQNSLMGTFINTANNYDKLLTSFTLISDYIKKDFVTMLIIISENYDKIFTICNNNKKTIKINDYIVQTPNDDLSKIQYYLDIIVKKKIQTYSKVIDFNINMWDIYISNPNNINFFYSLKSLLINACLYYDDFIIAISYIVRYTNKNFVDLLSLISANYEKIKNICLNERKSIIIGDYITQTLNDDIEKIKENYNFIVSQKLKDRYETIFFNIQIWNFYVFNNYKPEFLNYLESKLYEQAIYSKDIFDCMDFSSHYRSKNFISFLEILLFNFDRIQFILKNEQKMIDIQKYIIQQPQKDNIDKIAELIKKIVEKEKINGFCCIKFYENIWVPYTQCDNVEILKKIRRIITECKTIDPQLSEDTILLSQRIHDYGLGQIQKGALKENQLLQFLGEEEAFYIDRQVKGCINQMNTNANEIIALKKENNSLKTQLAIVDAKAIGLTEENALLIKKVNELQNDLNNIKIMVEENRVHCKTLDLKVKSLERRNYLS